MSERIIWQPVFIHRCEFYINLDRTFAKEMLAIRRSPQTVFNMNRLANERVKYLCSLSNPYHFYKESALLEQIYTGGNGRSLAANLSQENWFNTERPLEEPVQYITHNVDTPQQAWILTNLFELWVRNSDILKESGSSY